MPFLRRTVHLDRPIDPLWWVVAALLGLGSLWLPHLLGMDTDRYTRLTVVELSLFLSGALLGSLRPQGVWRWAVASFIAFAFVDLLRIANGPSLTMVTAERFWPELVNNSSLYMLHTVPVLVGAYLGCYLIKAD